MKILNFGSCNIDYVYSLDHIVEAGETEATERLDVFPGGKGLNQSIAIARAGGKVYHAGCVGFDGDMLTEVLEQSGVGLAELLGYSAVYTGGYIKKLTGRTFSELLVDKRCTVAAKMLSETDLSVGEIIAAVGYQNENFFRKAFRQKYGKNPLEYRKRGVK